MVLMFMKPIHHGMGHAILSYDILEYTQQILSVVLTIAATFHEE